MKLWHCPHVTSLESVLLQQTASTFLTLLRHDKLVMTKAAVQKIEEVLG